MAKYNLDKVKLRANVVSGLLLKRALLWGDQFPNSSIGDEFNYLNDKNRKEWKEVPKFNFTHLYFSQEVFQLIYDVSKRRSHQRILVPTRSHQRISTNTLQYSLLFCTYLFIQLKQS